MQILQGSSSMNPIKDIAQRINTIWIFILTIYYGIFDKDKLHKI